MFKGFMVSGNKAMWSVLKLEQPFFFWWVQNVCLPKFNNFLKKLFYSDRYTEKHLNGAGYGRMDCFKGQMHSKSMLLCKWKHFVLLLQPFASGRCNTLQYSPFLFTTASLQIMPGCKLQLPQAETTWLENGKAFTLTVIVTNVFMDIGVCFYTLLHSQLTPRIPQTLPQAAQ